jgi:hypothetical protein
MWPAFLAVWADAGVVVVGAEVVEVGVGVGEQVPDDDQDGAADRDDRSFLAAAFGDYRSPRKVSVLPVMTAASPRTRAR